MMKKCEKRNTASSLGKTQQHRFGSERGVALILVLVLSTIGLIVMTTVLYVLTMGTQISGSEKRYRTAHEAALGCVDVMRKIIQDQAASTIPGIPITYQASFMGKLNASGLTAYNTLVSIDTNSLSSYDLTVDVGNPVYRCFAKMVQKQQGNTNKGYRAVRIKTGVVPADPGMGLKNFTYYTFTILAQKATNPNERVRMDLVHIF
jgi:hypothetical protein